MSIIDSLKAERKRRKVGRKRNWKSMEIFIHWCLKYISEKKLKSGQPDSESDMWCRSFPSYRYLLTSAHLWCPRWLVEHKSECFPAWSSWGKFSLILIQGRTTKLKPGNHRLLSLWLRSVYFAVPKQACFLASTFSPHLLNWFSSVQFSRSVVTDSLRPHESQNARPPCPSPTPRVYSNSCPSSQWCHPAISSSVVPFSSCPQSLTASESFPMSQLFV